MGKKVEEAKKYVKDKIGALYGKTRAILNIAAPTAGVQYTAPLNTLDDKLRDVLKRHIGYDFQTGGFDPARHGTYATYYGWGVSMLNDAVDKHFRFALKRTKGKVHAWAPELLAMLNGYTNSKVDPRGPAWGFYRAFNKTTDGYDIGTDEPTEMFKLEHMEGYAKVKFGAIIYDTVVPKSWKRRGNSFFPKGINPF